MKDESTKNISRRDAIKILTAVAGAVALANIPSKWSKPELGIGVLPAHAQTSTSYTLDVGLSDPAANFCFPFTSTAAITPPDVGIPMHYSIATTGIVSVTSPVALTGTVSTDASGIAALSISVDTSLGAFNKGDIVTVVWTFENVSDGTGSGAQSFTSAGGGC